MAFIMAKTHGFTCLAVNAFGALSHFPTGNIPAYILIKMFCPGLKRGQGKDHDTGKGQVCLGRFPPCSSREDGFPL